jgi:hypothetical protein
MMIWQPDEILKLLILSLAIFLPFFTGSLLIVAGLSTLTDRIHGVYFANLAGSGLGCLAVLAPALQIGPHEILLGLSLLAVAAGIIAARHRYAKYASALTCILVGAAYLFFFQGKPLVLSPFKDLSQAVLLADAKRETDIFGAFGLVTTLDSPAYHYLPDLSLHYPNALPPQKGLFVDGNNVGAIQSWSGRREDLSFMDHRTASLAYRLLKRPAVLIIGGGGGTEILNARYHEASAIMVVEMNADIVHLMQGPYREYSGNVYDPEEVTVAIEDGRGFLQRTTQRYDLIHFGILESMNAVSAGVYGLSENYLFTMEALARCLDCLAPNGLLSITGWVRNPPREEVKLLAMAARVIEERRQNDPRLSLTMIRSWQTSTLLIKNGPFTAYDIGAVKTFCADHGFDTAYYPGITPEETNIFHGMEQNDIYETLRQFLSPAREAFIDHYPFYIRPATDDRPFFSYFFKPDLLKAYLDPGGRQWVPYLDWGYLLIWVTGIILLILALPMILAPLCFLKLPRGKRLTVFTYFSCLGLAYLFLEMAFFQQFIRYLWNPVYAAASVIGSFLFFSGVGSLLAGQVKNLRPAHILGSIALMTITATVLVFRDPWIGDLLSNVSLAGRIGLCSLLLSPLATPMGIFFPAGLARLRGKQAPLIPWAWGVNGFLSVLGGVIAVLIAMGWGFRTVVVLAILLYLMAGLTFRKLYP